MLRKLPLPFWSIAFPVIALLFYFTLDASGWWASLLILGLMGAVMAAVHHAEVIAHKVGEPFGTLVLAIAITVIEVSLIVSLMFAGGESTAALARDTVFAAVMIIITLMIGISFLAGGLKFKEQKIGLQGVSAALIGLIAICTLTLILPNYTTSAEGPVYTNNQLIFVAIISLIIYGTFVAIQTGRHRDYFLPEGELCSEDQHKEPPSLAITLLSVFLLMLSLIAVVLSSKALSPVIESTVVDLGWPKSTVGIIVALVILLPEGFAALRAARKDRIQTSLNLALGSALASIGLTIPAVAGVSIITGMTITLGIDMKSMLLFFLAIIVLMTSFVTRKTNVLQGVVLIVIFAVYLFTTIFP